MNDSRVISSRIRSAKGEATNGALAFRINVAASGERLIGEHDIRRWASGQSTPRSSRIGPLADALGVTVDYLLGRAENPRGVVIPGGGEMVLG